VSINYQSISTYIRHKYSPFKKFKILSKVLDFYFRIGEVSSEYEARKKFRTCKYWYFGGIYKILLLLVSFISVPFSQKKIYISLTRHKHLTNLIFSSLGQKHVIDAANINKNLNFRSFLYKIFLHRWVGCGIAQYLTNLSLLTKNKNSLFVYIIRVISEIFLRYEVFYYAIIIRVMSINVLCLSGSNVYSSKILTLAAKKANIDVVTVAHGYIYGGNLVSIFPAEEDFVYVYTVQQKRYIGKFINNHEREKIRVLGWPFSNKDVALRPMSVNNGRVLYIASDFFIRGGDYYEKLRKKSLQAILHLSTMYDSVDILLHPSERKKIDFIIKKYFSDNKNIYVMDSDPGGLTYNLIVGNTSTKLVEYAYSGIEVFQLESTRVVELEGVGVVKFNYQNNELNLTLSKPKLKMDNESTISKSNALFIEYLAEGL